MYRSNSSLPWTLEERKEGEEGEEDIWVVEERERERERVSKAVDGERAN